MRRRRAQLPARLLPAGAPARWAIVLLCAFVLLTLWWLTQDRATPSGDAAEELWAAFRFRDYLLHANVTGVLDYPAYYPPYGLLLGGLISLVGGISLNAVVLGQNLICASLLVLSCYQIGRRLAGAGTGALAVAFVLGSPLVIEQFHVFIIDATMASILALSVWLVLASERFSRVRLALLAGLAVGVGIGTKEQFPIYVAGLVAVAVARGGWRNLRGLAAFAGTAVVVAAPWYVHNASRLGRVWSAAGSGRGLLFPVPPLARPPLLSIANVEWYGWATLNGLLFAPLAAFALAGVAVAIARLGRSRAPSSVLPELLGGLVGSWLLLTVLRHKDMRYTLPLIVYLSVLGTAWIVRLPQRARRLATAGLAAAVVATTLGMTFGVGGAVPERPPGNLGAALGVGVPPRGRVVVYANHDYLVAGPRRDGGMLELLRGLRSIGVRNVYWDPSLSGPERPDFNGSGLEALAWIARLSVPRQIAEGAVLPRQALLMYEPVGRRPWGACVRFDDGMGVWVLIGYPNRPEIAFPYCPGRGVLGPPMQVPQITPSEVVSSIP